MASDLRSLVTDFLEKNGLRETSKTLQAESRGRALAADCDLARALASGGPTSVFDQPRPAGALSEETEVVAYNPAKGDPHGAAAMPLYQTATFAQPSATEFGAYDYTRSGNPTRDAAQKILAQLDGGCAAYCYSTGMAAIMAVTRFAKAGQEIILSDDSYGGTYRLLAQVASNQGITSKYVAMDGPEGPSRLLAAMTPRTALVMVESPTNPMVGVAKPERGQRNVRGGGQSEAEPPTTNTHTHTRARARTLCSL